MYIYSVRASWVVESQYPKCDNIPTSLTVAIAREMISLWHDKIPRDSYLNLAGTKILQDFPYNFGSFFQGGTGNLLVASSEHVKLKSQIWRFPKS